MISGSMDSKQSLLADPHKAQVGCSFSFYKHGNKSYSIGDIWKKVYVIVVTSFWNISVSFKKKKHGSKTKNISRKKQTRLKSTLQKLTVNIKNWLIRSVTQCLNEIKKTIFRFENVTLSLQNVTSGIKWYFFSTPKSPKVSASKKSAVATACT